MENYWRVAFLMVTLVLVNKCVVYSVHYTLCLKTQLDTQFLVICLVICLLMFKIISLTDLKTFYGICY